MAKVAFFLDTRRAIDNSYPLKLRLTHNCTNSSRSTGILLQKDQWDAKKQRVIRIKEADQLTKQLMALEINLMNVIDKLSDRGRLENMTAANIMAAAEGNSARPEENNNKDNSFLGWLSRYADGCRREKTAESFRYTGRTILIYIHTYAPKAKTIYFDEIDYQFVYEFRTWMKQQGMSQRTRQVHETNINTIFNHAIRCDFITYGSNPYRKLKKEPKKRKQKVYLKLELLHRLMMLDFSDVSGKNGLELARDAFLLSFYMQGASPKDLFLMPKPDEDGWIKYQRIKIDFHDPIPVDVYLNKEAKEIIKKYEGRSTLLNWCEHYANWDSFYAFVRHRLDRIGLMIGAEDITWYWARYTWSTFAQKTSPITGANEIAIDTMLGHQQRTLAGEVYASFDKEDSIPINAAVCRYATEGVHPRSVPAPKFIMKRGTKEIVDIWKGIKIPTDPTPKTNESVGTIESYGFNTPQNYYYFSTSPNYIYQIR